MARGDQVVTMAILIDRVNMARGDLSIWYVRRCQACYLQKVETISWGRTSAGSEITGTHIAISWINMIHGAPLKYSRVCPVGSDFRKKSVLGVITRGRVWAAWECGLLLEGQITRTQGRLPF